MIIRKILHICLLLFLLLGIYSPQAATLETDQNFVSKDLGDILEYFEDREHELNLEQAKRVTTWLPIEDGNFSKGFRQSQYWFRFDVVNTASTLQHYVIEVLHPFLDELDIIYEKSGQTQLVDRLGDQLSTQSRRLKHSDFLSDFALQPDERLSVYIRIASKSTLQLPASLWKANHYKEHNHNRSVIMGLLLGFMLAIATYHLLIYFSILEPVYLYYGFFMAGIVLTFACLNGYPGFFLWPEQKAEADNVLLLGLFACSTFNCLFARGVVDTPERTPRMNVLLNVCAAISIVSFLSFSVLPYSVRLKLAFLTGVVAIILVVSIFIITSLQRYQPAYYALAGSIFSGVGACITIFDKMGIIPGNAFNSQAVYVGFTLMALVQAFALSYRIKVSNDAHDSAQRELLIAQRTLNSELDGMVRQRTKELEQANTRLLELSMLDGLTGLYNRRYFDERLRREYRSAFRKKWHLGILILDIDNFKYINDTYGHLFGDICLKDVGSIVKRSVRRPNDIAVRYGGEEFVVLLPDTDIEGAVHIANSVRDNIKAHVFKDDEHAIQLTVSMGVNAILPDAPCDDPSAFVDCADKRLYHAKENGRDQICSE